MYQNQITDNIIRGFLDKKEINDFGNDKTIFSNTTIKFELIIEAHTDFNGKISNNLYLQGKVNQSVARVFV